MVNPEKPNHQEVLRLLPSVDALLRTGAAGRILTETGARHLTSLARVVSEELRQELQEKLTSGALDAARQTRENLLTEAERRLELIWQSEQSRGLRRVINATGVIIHTNLGRAPLSENARRAILAEASRYCALEYDLATGRRGRRGARAEQLLAELAGAESAVIVNNCAAAAFLVLTVLASGGEAIVSRGELVEIGGDFRVPDVMEQSGTVLREIGTTNRTKLSDYERAINENTRLILRVHPSNYRIVGFTATPDLAELSELAHRHNLLLFEDAGSGAIFDLSDYGLGEEPVISQSIAAGADVVTFSGDKLLGSAQAGLIVGRQETIERIRRHPLYRALRVDKLIYAALEATFEAYLREAAVEEIPVLQMLAVTAAEMRERTEAFAEKLYAGLGPDGALKFEIVEGKSVVGGGSAPMVQPATALLALRHAEMSAAGLEQVLRSSDPPVITRILEDTLVVDLRTVSPSEENELLEILAKI